MRFYAPSGGKLVAFLQSALPEKWSGKALRRLLEANGCRVNGRVERFGSASLRKGDLVEVAPDLGCQKRLPLQTPVVLYEDGDLLLVDKPCGWVCSEENCRHTFGSGVRLAHRLDKDTTGVLALSKNGKKHEELLFLFAQRKVEKEYLALVDGVVRREAGVQESRFKKKRVFAGQTVWGSGAEGLFAETHWKTVSVGHDASLLLCKPITGRTHQIRVHLAEMGHPILVDRHYAERFRSSLTAARPLLHALTLRIGSIEGRAPIPQDMKQAFQNVSVAIPERVSGL